MLRRLRPGPGPGKTATQAGATAVGEQPPDIQQPTEDIDSDPPVIFRLSRSEIARAMLFPIVLIALFAIAQYYGLAYRARDRAAVEEALLEWGWRAPVLFVFASAAMTLMFGPRTLIGLIGGFIFGWVGFFYTWAAAIISDTLGFALAYSLVRPLIEKLLGRRNQRVLHWIEVEGFWAVIVLRMMPFVPTFVINYGSGFAAGVRYRDYIFATMIGIVPGCLLFTLSGWLMQAEPLNFFLSIPVFGVPLVLAGAVIRYRIEIARKTSPNNDTKSEMESGA